MGHNAVRSILRIPRRILRISSPARNRVPASTPQPPVARHEVRLFSIPNLYCLSLRSTSSRAPTFARDLVLLARRHGYRPAFAPSHAPPKQRVGVRLAQARLGSDGEHGVGQPATYRAEELARLRAHQLRGAEGVHFVQNERALVPLQALQVHAVSARGHVQLGVVRGEGGRASPLRGGG